MNKIEDDIVDKIILLNKAGELLGEMHKRVIITEHRSDGIYLQVLSGTTMSDAALMALRIIREAILTPLNVHDTEECERIRRFIIDCIQEIEIGIEKPENPLL